MCRTGGRRCPSNSDPVKVANRNQRRRELYSARKKNTISASVNLDNNTVNTKGLNVEQLEFFKQSKIMKDDELLPLYHGSAHEFSSFDPKSLGKGNDSWGNGFYFTDQKNSAQGYADEAKSNTANVKEFYLNLTNPMYVDGKKNMSLNNVFFSKEVAVKVLKQHPNAYLQPSEDDEAMSFLADYAPEYWDKKEHSKAELDHMIETVADEYFSDTSWVELESLYGKEHGQAFLKAISEETGHDGIVVDFGKDGKHYVAWFPNQMKLTTNENPTNNDLF